IAPDGKAWREGILPLMTFPEIMKTLSSRRMSASLRHCSKQALRLRESAAVKPIWRSEMPHHIDVHTLDLDRPDLDLNRLYALLDDEELERSRQFHSDQ